MGVLSEVLIVVGQDSFEKLVLFFCLRFYHVLAVVGIEEELTRLGVGNEFDKVVVT